MLYDNDGKKRLFKKRHGQSLTFLFKAIRSLPKAMAIRMWFTVLAPKSRCQRQHVSAHGELFKKPPMTVLYDPMWKKNFSRKDEDRTNVPIQNPSVFIKDNDDWVGVRSWRVFQGNPLFMEWRELSSNILKMGEARLTLGLIERTLKMWNERILRSWGHRSCTVIGFPSLYCVFMITESVLFFHSPFLLEIS